MKIVFATQNKGKLIEMKVLLSDWEVISASEAGVSEEIVEDGKTFIDNSLKKARYVAERTNEWAVADDSGLCIKALDGAPGVYSARWAGENADDMDLVNYTLAKMKNVLEPERQAWFESAVALVSPDGKEYVFSGRINGSIALAPAGKNRPKLPYDLIFRPTGEERTFAQMSDAEKNSMSHRGLAFKKLKEFLVKNN